MTDKSSDCASSAGCVRWAAEGEFFVFSVSLPYLVAEIHGFVACCEVWSVVVSQLTGYFSGAHPLPGNHGQR